MTTSIPLRTTLRHVQPSIVIVDLAGDINRDAEAALNQVSAAITDDSTSVLLNFTEVAYINSTGIALIISLLARARQQGRAVAAFGLSDHYREIFDITRLSDFISIYPDEHAALSVADWRSK